MRDFKQLFRRGKSFGNRHLILKVAQSERDYSRFAFIVSTKTAKKAVDRNRAKRQLREIIKAELPSVKSGYDIALTIKPGFLPLSFEEKTKTAHQLLRKANLLTK
jgi:ribonuclease P protein component